MSKSVFGVAWFVSRIATESSAMLRLPPFGSPVLVMRTTKRGLESSSKIVNIDGETVVFQLDKARALFRSKCVRPVVQLYEKSADSTEQSPVSHPANVLTNVTMSQKMRCKI